MVPLLLAAAAMFSCAPQGGPSVSWATPPAPKRPFTLVFPDDPATITVPNATYYGWALLERTTGRSTSSANAATKGNTTESMIKPWIVSDYLRRLNEAGKEPSDAELNELTLVIVDSNDPLAEKYYRRGGADAVVNRLVNMCGLTNLVIKPNLWGWTVMTPVDALRYGQCLGDGRAAGPQWTDWVLDTMKHIRGSVAEQKSGSVQGGRWGIIDGLPQEVVKDISFKNGWTAYRDGWHVNCLAIHPEFVLDVMMRTWAHLDEAAAGCASIAAMLIVDNQP